MSIVFSKKKEKRSRSSSSEPNNSFVKNVTSRVSGLLPATITKWFSSPSSNTNGSAQTADGTDSSSEDEALESPITTEPPTKRMRFTSPATYNQFDPSNVWKKSNWYLDFVLSLTDIEKFLKEAPDSQYVATKTNSMTISNDSMDQCKAYNTVQSTPGRTTFRRDTNFVSTPLCSPSEETTPDETEKDSTMFKSQHSLSTIGSSVATKRKSLFDSPAASEASLRACAKTSANTMRDPSQPCFKPSLLGSPFYPGRTMYGGAAAYINQPNIQTRKNTLVHESTFNNDNTISHSARRIMDLLEQYSSPLNEARRIAPYVHHTRESPSNSSLETSSPYANKVRSYKTQELHVPSLASILRLKQRSRLMDTTTAARQIIASHSSTADYLPYISHSTQRDQTERESNNKLTTKVKSRLTRLKRGDADLETNLPTPVDLPSAVLLIDQNNLPKFSFGTSKVSQAPSSTSTPKAASFTNIDVSTKEKESITINNIMETPIRKPDTVSNSYKFASPLRIASDSSRMTTTTPPKFTFGSPDRSIDRVQINEIKVDDSSCVVGASKADAKTTVTPKTEDITDGDNYVCSGGKKPKHDKDKPAKCAVCNLADSQLHVDKCATCEKANNNVTLAATKDTSKWTCQVCWVNNNETDDKCVCCSGTNPNKFGAANTNAVAKDTSVTLAATKDTSKWTCQVCWVNNNETDDNCICCNGKNPNKFGAAHANAVAKDTSSDWKCDVCWVQNKSTTNACIACGGSKPGVESAPSHAAAPSGFSLFKATKPPDQTIKNIVNMQSQKWECTNCLARNDTDKHKCVCCEAQRPGTTKEPEKKTFNFGMNASSFKFGINPKAQEAATKLAEENTTTETKPKAEESETNNNVLPKAPAFSFGVPAKKPDDQIDSAKKIEEKAGSAPRTNFTFGVPASASKVSVTQTVTPVFGTPSKPTEPAPKNPTEENEKLQEVPIVNFGVQKTQEGPKTNSTNLFTSPSTSKDKSEAPPLMNTFKYTSEKKESSTTASLTMKLPESTPKTNTFSFSGSGTGIKPAVNLFGSPSTTSAGSAFAPPSQTTAVTMFSKSELTVTTTPMFQKPDATKPSVPLFQKSDTQTTTAAPPSQAPNASLFGFGSGAQVAAPQADKPKFNFTFGSTDKTEALALFKTTFGAPSDSSNTNKFALPTVNATGNGLGGNGANTLSGNMLQTNPQGRNELNNSLTSNSLQPSTATPPTGLFAAPVQKENMWSPKNNTTNNLFVSNATTNNLQKPAAFTFGSQFNSSQGTSTFGSGAQVTSAPSTFGIGAQSTTSTFGSGASTTPATFGSGAQATPATFGSGAQATPATFGSGAQATPSTFGNGAQTTPSTFGSGGQGTQSTFGSGAQAAQSTFGSGAQGTASTFGSGAQAKPSPFSSGAQVPQSTFGSGAQSTPVFGMGSQNTSSQPSLFSSPVQSTPAGSLFAQPASNPAPAMGMFGSPSVGAASSFGPANPSVPPFEASSLTPAPAPAFNFGAPQSTGIFGFGQQQTQQAQPQQAGMYNFGGPASGGAVQFNMGSAPSPARRMRKAMRRNTPR